MEYAFHVSGAAQCGPVLEAQEVPLKYFGIAQSVVVGGIPVQERIPQSVFLGAPPVQFWFC